MPDPTFQIRIIGPRAWAERIVRHLTTHATTLIGPHDRCTTQIRAARRVGHVRAYLTVTPREDDPE
jgi:hypothetical protein